MGQIVKHYLKKKDLKHLGHLNANKQLDQSNIDLNSEEWKSDINLNERNEKDINPGRIFSKSKLKSSLIDDIPLSAFESSRSSDSNDTFESQYEEDMNVVEELDQADQVENVNLHNIYSNNYYLESNWRTKDSITN